jgi:zinc and cadmium transporter
MKTFLVPFAAGGFIYMALADLMPELHKKTRYGRLSAQIATLLAGIGLMGWLKMAQ